MIKQLKRAEGYDIAAEPVPGKVCDVYTHGSFPPTQAGRLAIQRYMEELRCIWKRTTGKELVGADGKILARLNPSDASKDAQHVSVSCCHISLSLAESRVWVDFLGVMCCRVAAQVYAWQEAVARCPGYFDTLLKSKTLAGKQQKPSSEEFSRSVWSKFSYVAPTDASRLTSFKSFLKGIFELSPGLLPVAN